MAFFYAEICFKNPALSARFIDYMVVAYICGPPCTLE